MWDILKLAWQVLSAMPDSSLFALFWLTILVEAPRHGIGLQATAMALTAS